MPELAGDQLKGFLDEIDRHDDELASLRGSFMAQCKGPHEAIREILTSLRESGTNMKAFRVMLKGHRNDRKQAARVAELEIEDAQAYETMIKALGEFADTPLGSAAIDGARRRTSSRSRRGSEGFDLQS
jgi:uncharacterized protein (UPF0335 family)